MSKITIEFEETEIKEMCAKLLANRLYDSLGMVGRDGIKKMSTRHLKELLERDIKKQIEEEVQIA